MKHESINAALHLTQELVLAICKYPEQCRFETQFEPSASMTIHPHTADYPVLCGARGRQIHALAKVAEKMGFTVHLVESFVGQSEPRDAFVPDPQFDTDGLLETVRDFCGLLFEGETTVTAQPDGDRLRIFIQPELPQTDALPLISALGQLFYPLGIRQGRKLEVRACQPAKVKA